MIITVTLNAAIDKSLSVPSFRLGRRHRTVERRALAGGKGVNIARMLKTLGQPVIATGFQGGPTGTQIVAQLAEESILHDFVRIREESRTNTSVLDPTTGEQTEINEQGPAVDRRRGRAVPREAPLPGARRGDRRLRRLAAARRRPRLLRAARARAAQARRDDGRRHRRRGAAARGARRARRRLAERRRGRGARRARVQRRRRPRRRGARDRLARRALGDHDDARRLLGADARRRRAARLPRDGAAASSRSATVGSGDAFLAGYIAAALPRRARRPSACASASPAAPSRPAGSAPG